MEMDSGERPNPISSTISYRSSHIVSIPYPGRGHINPMINLCRLLSPRIGLTITIILTEEWIKLISSDSSSPNLPDNIEVRSIPNVLPSERTRGNNYTEFFEAVMSKMADPVQRVLNELNPPADIVVADALLPWIVDICKQMNVPAVSLWTESASLFFALYKFDRLDAAGGLPEDFSGDEALSYLPNVSSTHIANLLPNATTFDILRAFSRNYYWFHPAHSLLTTSFDKLEISVMEKIRSEFSIPIYQIGPLIPHNLLFPSPKPTNPDFSSYFSWLDSQPNSSVLYVSLGSFLSISDHQMEEIAMGLIQSKVKFLWVLRDKLFCVDKVDEDTGFILPWCDQLRVLCHSSVGGFLTHCGWNSTLEAIYAGVPMITFPLFWDQQPNSKLVVDDWKIGLRLKENDEQTVKREMIVKKVKKLMDFDDEESKGMRERVARLKEVCQAALEDGGSSQQNLDEFLQQMFLFCEMSSSRSTTSMQNLDIPIYCHCNLQCSILTCYKPNNHGRKFFRCPHNESEHDCQFFRWVDERNDLSEEMTQFTNASEAEVYFNHIVLIRNELFQIKMLLVVIIILLLVVCLKLISKCCSCK